MSCTRVSLSRQCRNVKESSGTVWWDEQSSSSAQVVLDGSTTKKDLTPPIPRRSSKRPKALKRQRTFQELGFVVPNVSHRLEVHATGLDHINMPLGHDLGDDAGHSSRNLSQGNETWPSKGFPSMALVDAITASAHYDCGRFSTASSRPETIASKRSSCETSHSSQAHSETFDRPSSRDSNSSQPSSPNSSLSEYLDDTEYATGDADRLRTALDAESNTSIIDESTPAADDATDVEIFDAADLLAEQYRGLLDPFSPQPRRNPTATAESCFLSLPKIQPLALSSAASTCSRPPTSYLSRHPAIHRKALRSHRPYQAYALPELPTSSLTNPSSDHLSNSAPGLPSSCSPQQDLSRGISVPPPPWRADPRPRIDPKSTIPGQRVSCYIMNRPSQNTPHRRTVSRPVLSLTIPSAAALRLSTQVIEISSDLKRASSALQPQLQQHQSRQQQQQHQQQQQNRSSHSISHLATLAAAYDNLQRELRRSASISRAEAAQVSAMNAVVRPWLEAVDGAGRRGGQERGSRGGKDRR